VLIRLWELADSSFGLNGGPKSSEAVRLAPPQQPLPGDGGIAQAAVWRLMKLVIQPFMITVHMRSPEQSAFTYNHVWARWIMRLPADMPNMDVIVDRVRLVDQFGSSSQLFGNLKRKYRKIVKYSAIRSIILSYVATVLKGLCNALWWLFRGPFDALIVSWESPSRKGKRWWSLQSLLWWVSPLIRGFSEGMYRSLVEIVGNTVFFIVLILNAIRHLILGSTRKRAHGILDGLVYGFQGLLLDIIVTPLTRMVSQTTVAYQDWGNSMAVFVFVLCSVRLLFGAGPVLGVFHLLACVCEGLANALLHEEVQFAPFEGQRRTESVVFDPQVDESAYHSDMDVSRHISNVQNMKMPLPKKWWLFSKAKMVVTDDDAVMDQMGLMLNL